jgi:hypothetical protein
MVGSTMAIFNPSSSNPLRAKDMRLREETHRKRRRKTRPPIYWVFLNTMRKPIPKDLQVNLNRLNIGVIGLNHHNLRWEELQLLVKVSTGWLG